MAATTAQIQTDQLDASATEETAAIEATSQATDSGANSTPETNSNSSSTLSEPLSDFSTDIKAEDYDIPTITLENADVPLSAMTPHQSWGLVNLLFVGACILEFLAFAGYELLRRNLPSVRPAAAPHPGDANKGFGQTTRAANRPRRSVVPLIGVIVVSAVSVAVFAATEDMSLPRAITDGWTPTMIALFLLESVIIGFSGTLNRIARQNRERGRSCWLSHC
ncbi:MAG: hypothetical protein LBR39_04015 [Coriobacteriales bacterium]|nr:hypothetical protein [Coriobacteriales bacterium]